MKLSIPVWGLSFTLLASASLASELIGSIPNTETGRFETISTYRIRCQNTAWGL